MATSEPVSSGLIPSGEIMGLEGAHDFNSLDRYRQSDLKISFAISAFAFVTLSVGCPCCLTHEGSS